MQETKSEMTTRDVLAFVQLLDRHNIGVYIDGGWGVDALLGRQTRVHSDLDIAVEHKDVPQIRALLEAQGYRDVPRDDTRDCNFVLGDDAGHLIDVHSYTFDAEGNLVFGVAYPYESLSGTGSIDGFPVKCISPEWMVDFHTGYPLDENDYQDVRLLCERFGIALPREYSAFLERDLRAHRPDGAPPLPEGFVWPRYEGLSVGNLAATVGQALGATLPGVLPPLRGDLLGGLLDGARRVVLVVIDALGWETLQDVMARHPDLIFHRLAAQGRLWPVTTTFLSTTNSVLSAIHTGRSPAEHGLLAYSLFLREWQMAVESITFSPIHRPFTGTLAEWGFEAETFLPVPAIGQLLAVQGIASCALTHDRFVKTPLSLMHHRGMQDVFGYATASDFWLTLRRILEQHRDEPCFVSAYWSAVDTLAHRLGPLDESADAEIVSLALLMEEIFFDRLTPAAREGTLLLLTADHGQITTPPESAILLDQHPTLLDALFLPPLGEGRAPFFYVRNGKYDVVRQYLNEHFAGQFAFFSQDEILRSGLLGPGVPGVETRHRLGDIVGIAMGDAYFAPDAESVKNKPMLGRHGSLTPQEMLVPLLAVRLDG